jgi:hypothetical protein
MVEQIEAPHLMFLEVVQAVKRFYRWLLLYPQVHYLFP